MLGKEGEATQESKEIPDNEQNKEIPPKNRKMQSSSLSVGLIF